MKQESQDKNETFEREKVKVYGPMRFIKSIKYSLDGLFYAYRYEQSLWIHGCAVIIAIILGIILALELINTAIEAAVDLTTTKIHPLAKVAKDCGSAASFVMSIVSIVISLFVFGPYFLDVIDKIF